MLFRSSHTRARTFAKIPVPTISLTRLMTAMITLPFPTPITLHGGRHRILVRYRCVLAPASLARLDRPVSPALGTSSGGGIALWKNPLVKPPCNPWTGTGRNVPAALSSILDSAPSWLRSIRADESVSPLEAVSSGS